MTDREQKILGLRQLADFLETHPEVQMPSIWTLFAQIPANEVKSTARALRTFKKAYKGDDFEMVKSFGSIEVKWYTNRDAVCEKVVVGTKEVPEMIIAAKPEQLIPASEEEIIPAHTEEITEWICSDAALMEPENSEIAS